MTGEGEGNSQREREGALPLLKSTPLGPLASHMISRNIRSLGIQERTLCEDRYARYLHRKQVALLHSGISGLECTIQARVQDFKEADLSSSLVALDKHDTSLMGRVPNLWADNNARRMYWRDSSTHIPQPLSARLPIVSTPRSKSVPKRGSTSSWRDAESTMTPRPRHRFTVYPTETP
ncbi:hypothetical protein CYMTET_17160 [Cymbomonas tetramitiformis]|uniref:Uncharacterized protein n=1 Tax=Cymbomonas tetramitiformis TaxID=36881 RepID=A0AAE0L780_9CHLO|nr:hypothetical protein CYMTET_17160 [Cymbomonas tetramitiformis]